jgi:putative FmdB family regulatory protein
VTHNWHSPPESAKEASVPTYQYACTACGEQLEAVQSFTDDPLTECPVCGGALRKVFSAVGVVFKGSGFYKNDSRKGGSGSGSGGDTKQDTKSDTAAKSDSKSDATKKSDAASSTTKTSTPESKTA